MVANNKIGVSTNCECGNTLSETLQLIKKAGFSHVMLSEQEAGMPLDDAIKLVRDIGLETAYVHLSFGEESDLLFCSLDDSVSGVAKICENIKTLSKHSIEVAVIHPIHYMESKYTKDKKDEIGVANMKKIIRFAERFKVKIALENGRTISYDKDIETLLDNVKSDYLGLCYDNGHHNAGNAKYNWFTKYFNRVFAIHLHDNFGKFDEHLLPFDGNADFELVIKRIAKSNYNGVVMLELHRINYSKKIVHEQYKSLTSLEYLQEGYVRGQKILQLLNAYK